MIRIHFWVLLLCVLLAVPAVAQEGIELSETFTSENGGFSFSYPSGWALEASEFSDYLDVSIATRQDVIDRDIESEVFTPGDAQIQLFIDEFEAITEVVELPADAEADIILTKLVEMVIRMEEPVRFGEVIPIELGESSGAKVEVIFGDNGQALIALTRYDNGLIGLLFLTTAPGELAQWEAAALAVFESIQFHTFAIPTDQPIFSLSETYSDGDTALRYPEGWLTRGGSDESVYIATTQTALDHFAGSEYSPGEAQIFVDVAPMTELATRLDIDLRPEDSPLKVLQALIKLAAADGDDIVLGRPETLSVGQWQAATVTLSGIGYEGRVWIARYAPGVIVTGQVFSAPGERAAWEATALAVLESVTYAASSPVPGATGVDFELTQTAYTGDGLMDFQYPAGWFARAGGSNAVYVGSTEAAAAKDFGSAFDSGEVNIYVAMDAIADFSDMMNLPLTAEATPLEFMAAMQQVVPEVNLSEPEAVSIGTWEAARVSASSEFGFDVTAWAIAAAPRRLVVVQLLTAPGESDQWEATALAIAESVALALD